MSIKFPTFEGPPLPIEALLGPAGKLRPVTRPHRGPQNPTPTSTLVRAGNRLTRLSFPITLMLGASVWLTGEVVLGLPDARAWGGWVWGALSVWGGWAPTWGVGPAGLLVRALGNY